MKKTFNEVYRDFLEYKRLRVKKSTLSAYALIIRNHILPMLGNTALEDVGSVIANNMAVELMKQDSISRKTAIDIMIVVKNMVSWYSCVNDTPMKSIKIDWPTQSREKKEKMQYLDKNALTNLINYLKENPSSRNIGLQLCFCTGVRIGELCSFKFSDIDWDNHTIRVNRTIERCYNVDTLKTEIIISTPKTSCSNRDIPLINTIYNDLKKLSKIYREDYYILSCNEKPIEPRTYRVYWKNLLTQLGMPQIKFHAIRHTFATQMLQNKIDIVTISKCLGHSNTTTTLNIYSHTNIEERKKGINSTFSKIFK